MDRARMAPLFLLLLLPLAAAAPSAPPAGKSPPVGAKAPAPAPPGVATPPKTNPACPLTGKPPTKPVIPHSRCVEAQKLSCCEDCADLTFPIQALAINVTAAVEPATGGALDPATIPPNVCALFQGHEECEQLVEQLVCAVTCNPDSGYYFIDTPTGPYMQVCTKFAQQLYDKCSKLSIGSLALSDIIYVPEDLIKGAIVPLIAQAVPGFTAGVGDVGCYGGPQVVPATPLCCDPLTIPQTCPTGSVNTTGAEKIPGRKPDQKICAKYPYKTGTTPFARPPLPATAFDKPSLPVAPSSAPAPGSAMAPAPGSAMAPSPGGTVDGATPSPSSPAAPSPASPSSPSSPTTSPSSPTTPPLPPPPPPLPHPPLLRPRRALGVWVHPWQYLLSP
ncbi:hypothetical protein CLOM_g9 [Closterium sp. NIES-68]|nr:hypothetical protein CLOM_g9 [Closterium sp. NIES-68]